MSKISTRTNQPVFSEPAASVPGVAVTVTYSDLPPQIVSLARQIARNCATPGDYVVHLRRSPYPGAPLDASIQRVDTIRELSIPKK